MGYEENNQDKKYIYIVLSVPLIWSTTCGYSKEPSLIETVFLCTHNITELRHAISNNVAFWQV